MILFDYKDIEDLLEEKVATGVEDSGDLEYEIREETLGLSQFHNWVTRPYYVVSACSNVTKKVEVEKKQNIIEKALKKPRQYEIKEKKVTYIDYSYVRTGNVARPDSKKLLYKKFILPIGISLSQFFVVLPIVKHKEKWEFEEIIKVAKANPLLLMQMDFTKTALNFDEHRELKKVILKDYVERISDKDTGEYPKIMDESEKTISQFKDFCIKAFDKTDKETDYLDLSKIGMKRCNMDEVDETIRKANEKMAELREAIERDKGNAKI